MSTAILVTGGTGTLGRKLVRKLVAAGRDVRVLSRKDRPGIEPGTPKLPDWPDWFIGDLKTGIGIPKALEGVGVVVHCANVPGSDVEAAAQLLIAATRASKPHTLYPSLIGADKIEDDVYRDRRAIERLLADSELPWTVMRVSQLHEHLDATLKRASRLPVVMVPADTDYQPIAAEDVAERLFDICQPMQAHQLPDLAGPEVIDAEDLTAFWLKSTHKKRKLVVTNLRGGLYAGYRQGYHLAPDRAYGRQTFAEFVAETYGPDVDTDGLAAKGKKKAEKPEKPAKEKAPKPPKDPDAPKERRAWLGRNRELDEDTTASDDATTT